MSSGRFVDFFYNQQVFEGNVEKRHQNTTNVLYLYPDNHTRSTQTMIADLHSHTYYSHCGRDLPETVIETAIQHKIDVLGITDHNYGIGERKREYRERMTYLKEKYASQIILLCGIEISTLPHLYDIKEGEIDDYDYCLLEHIDHEESRAYHNFFGFSSKLPIKVGVAHTDLFAYAGKIGMTPQAFFKQMAEQNIFWEMTSQGEAES